MTDLPHTDTQTSFPLTDRFTAALTLASHWHAGQYRKVTGSATPTVPYLSHLLGVASIALEYGATEDQAVAALLHDALEDGPANTGHTPTHLREQIAGTFGESVARLVDDATDDTPAPGQPKRPWPARKTEYLSGLHHKSAASLLVSAADKLHNARTILADVSALPTDQRHAYFDRFGQGHAGTMQYYRLLSDHYQAAPATHTQPRLRALLRELERTVTDLEHATGLTADQTRGLPLLRDAQAPRSQDASGTGSV
ncbi:hypothetical protein GCM10008959_13160 [Deinococcus seoulensis]|uniref:HD/PDEase domain-containing protein n=1 Tax=Deinococcus seoulensis TaxID=1837379 RepID=A0ABQ2RNR2_9DEIO|nr:HD domain-containing protein [Deinococcus seoulensis]GGR53072.1 hypothetical protein GCM10008959_13160 [Deinococcus seoulensis]